MFVKRNFNRTEHDDYILHVQPLLDERTESLEIVVDGVVIGWKVQLRFE